MQLAEYCTIWKGQSAFCKKKETFPSHYCVLVLRPGLARSLGMHSSVAACDDGPSKSDTSSLKDDGRGKKQRSWSWLVGNVAYAWSVVR